MFELVIGELDSILERLEKKSASLESSLFKMMMESRSDDDMRRQIDRLGDSLTGIREELEPENERKAKIGSILSAIGQNVGVNHEYRPG